MLLFSTLLPFILDTASSVRLAVVVPSQTAEDHDQVKNLLEHHMAGFHLKITQFSVGAFALGRDLFCEELNPPQKKTQPNSQNLDADPSS